MYDLNVPLLIFYAATEGDSSSSLSLIVLNALLHELITCIHLYGLISYSVIQSILLSTNMMPCLIEYVFVYVIVGIENPSMIAFVGVLLSSGAHIMDPW